MKKLISSIVVLLSLLVFCFAQNPPARGTHYSSKSDLDSSYTASKGIKRDSKTHRIERSESARHEFMRETGYPHGRSGYVIDHIRPLSCGGKDDPSNMQWQTKEEAKEKDKWERKIHYNN